METTEATLDLIERNTKQTESESDPFTIERYELMARFVRNKDHVLDVGCNTGRGGQRLKELLPDINLTGIDLVAARIAALPKCYSAGIVSSATKIIVANESFHAVMAGEFIEHVPPHDIDRTICEFQRVLKINGQLIMTTPNPGALLAKIQGRTVLGESHLTQHWPDCLKLRMRMHGFRNVRLFGSGKATRYLGINMPLFCYGSFLIVGIKF